MAEPVRPGVGMTPITALANDDLWIVRRWGERAVIGPAWPAFGGPAHTTPVLHWRIPFRHVPYTRVTASSRSSDRAKAYRVSNDAIAASFLHSFPLVRFGKLDRKSRYQLQLLVRVEIHDDRPDLENMVKAIPDALQIGGILPNDKVVAACASELVVVPKDQAEGTTVQIRAIRESLVRFAAER